MSLHDEMACMLKRLEWAAGGSWGPSGDDSCDTDYSCPVCGGLKNRALYRRVSYLAGHEPGCELDALLRKTGVADKETR
jgi:hypothetical protein